MNDSSTASAFAIERRNDGVVVVRIDVPDESVNTLRANFAGEIDGALDAIEKQSDVKAVVITSGAVVAGDAPLY